VRYKKDDFIIAVEKIAGFGQHKGLWIGKGNEIIKVASFGNDDKAEMFMRYLDYYLGVTDEITWEGIR
jgi:hypothetical protein